MAPASSRCLTGSGIGSNVSLDPPIVKNPSEMLPGKPHKSSQAAAEFPLARPPRGRTTGLPPLFAQAIRSGILPRRWRLMIPIPAGDSWRARWTTDRNRWRRWRPWRAEPTRPSWRASPATGRSGVGRCLRAIRGMCAWSRRATQSHIWTCIGAAMHVGIAWCPRRARAVRSARCTASPTAWMTA